MPIAPNVSIILGGNNNSGFRTLVLIDDTKSNAVYVKFSHDFDDSSSKEAVSQLFDESYNVMSQPEILVADKALLPIIGYIGRFSDTIVKRNGQGDIVILDGTSKPVDGYMGVGG